MCSSISVCVVCPQRHWSNRGRCEMLRCPVSSSYLREFRDRCAARKKNHIPVSSFFILSVPKLTLVLSCRGYHLPDLIRERNTGKVHNLCPRYGLLSYHHNHASQVEEIPQRLSTPSFSQQQFPYALRALPTVLATQWDSASFAPYRDAFPAEHRSSPAALEAHVRDLTARDVKAAYHKNLQGYLWEDGYASGAYATDLFADVVPCLKAWRAQGRDVAIYSSGSVFAQKLLMRHVKVNGATENLEGLVSGGWFDTVNAGLKAERGSYERISGELKVRVGLFPFLMSLWSWRSCLC